MTSPCKPMGLKLKRSPPIDGTRGAGIHTFTLNVKVDPPAVVSIADDFTVGVNQAFSFTPTNTGGIASWTAENLPAWLILDSATGNISGTPPSVDAHTNILLRAENIAGNSDTGAFTINVVAQTLLPALSGTPSQGKVDQPYVFAIGNTGGAVDQWSLSVSSSLPAGLSLANGVIAGTPLQAGTFADIEVIASNSAGNDSLLFDLMVDKGDQAPLSFDVSEPVIKTINDDPFTIGVSGGSGTGARSYQSSNSGVVSVDASSGLMTPIGTGQATITVAQAEDANYLAVSATIDITINAVTGVILGDPEAAIQYENYSFAPTLADGINVSQWRIESGELPQGLSLNTATGEISGIPFDTGVSEFQLAVITTDNDIYIRNFTLEVLDPLEAPNLENEINNALCEGGIFEGYCSVQLAQNEPVNLLFSAGTSLTPTWTIEGELPPGLSFAEGIISGTPTMGGEYDVTLNASNDLGEDDLFLTISVLGIQPPLVFETTGAITRSYQAGNFTNAATGGADVGSITYRSADTGVATVHPSTGQVFLQAPGTTTIIAERSGDSEYLPVSAEYTLTVTLDAPEIEYLFIDEVDENGLISARLNARVTPRINFAFRTELTVSGEANTTIVDVNSNGTVQVAGLEAGENYSISAQLIHNNGERSPVSEPIPVVPHIAEQRLAGESNTGFGYRLAMDGDVMVVTTAVNDAYAQESDLYVFERIDGSWLFTQRLPYLQDFWGRALDVHQHSDGSYRIAAGTNASSNFGSSNRQGGMATYVKAEIDICDNDVDDNNNGQVDEAGCLQDETNTAVYNNGVWAVDTYHAGIYPTELVLSDDWLAVGRIARASSIDHNCDSGIF